MLCNFCQACQSLRRTWDKLHENVQVQGVAVGPEVRHDAAVRLQGLQDRDLVLNGRDLLAHDKNSSVKSGGCIFLHNFPEFCFLPDKKLPITHKLTNSRALRVWAV